MTDQDKQNKRPHSDAFPTAIESYEPPPAKKSKSGIELASVLHPLDAGGVHTPASNGPATSTNGPSTPPPIDIKVDIVSGSSSAASSPTVLGGSTSSSGLGASDPAAANPDAPGDVKASLDEDEAAQAMLWMFADPVALTAPTATTPPPAARAPPKLKPDSPPQVVQRAPPPVRKQHGTPGKKASLRDDINVDEEYFDDEYDDGTYRDEDSVEKEISAYGDDGDYQAGGKPKGPKGKRGRKRKTDENYEEEDDDNKLYCVCRRPYIAGVFMIACDLCNDWYHGECVGITKRQASKIKQYICPSCSKPKPERQKQRTQNADDDFNPNGSRPQKASTKEPGPEQRTPRTSTGGASSLPKQRVPKGDVKCVYAACADFARVGSKYCSHECGIRFALEKIERDKSNTRAALKAAEERDRVDSYMELLDSIRKETAAGVSLSVAEQHDMQILDNIDREKQLIANKRQTLDKNRAVVESQIEKARSLPEVPDDADYYAQLGPTSDVYDCVSCGQPVAASKLPRHMETCFVKVESHHPIVGPSPTPTDDGANIVACDFYDLKTKSFCKKLKASCPLHSSLFNKSKRAFKTNAACGFPTKDSPSNFCELAKRDCPKHVNWESIRLAELVLEDISLNQALNQLLYEEKIAQERMYQRRLIRAGEPSLAAEGPVSVS